MAARSGSVGRIAALVSRTAQSVGRVSQEVSEGTCPSGGGRCAAPPLSSFAQAEAVDVAVCLEECGPQQRSGTQRVARRDEETSDRDRAGRGARAATPSCSATVVPFRSVFLVCSV